jgi:pilus assembly protein Flp/PilA
MFDYMMAFIRTNITSHIKSEKGQGLVEYGLIIAVIAIAIIAAMVFLKNQIGNIFGRAGNELAANH